MIRGTDCRHFNCTRAAGRQVHAWPTREPYCGCETSIRNAADPLSSEPMRSGQIATETMQAWIRNDLMDKARMTRTSFVPNSRRPNRNCHFALRPEGPKRTLGT